MRRAAAAHRAAAGRGGARAGCGARPRTLRVSDRRRADGGAGLGAAGRHDPARARAYAPVTITGRGGPAADLTLAGDAGATRRRHDDHRLAADRRQRPRPSCPSAARAHDPRRDLERRHVPRPAASTAARAAPARRWTSPRRATGVVDHRLDVPALLVALLHPHVLARRRDPAQHVRRPRRHRRRARLRRRRDPRQPHGSRAPARRRATTTTSSRSAPAGPGRSTATGSACARAAPPRSGSIRSTAG